ncbi:ABC-type spermidine/putrescine transport system, permease component I [Frankia torreyi]|uniref:ABC-type spermidine/putrescine transport system, permease component I n=1 Tax=Frankia torreyi TaxID=1856 RepID=A0A0D8BF01_9ACTN|nr:MULTISPECIES: ABC transporter permease [Frankia]KJE22645.1 ABC-type spermidine/putrescine transport system, permease component I [Frankia torreyi]
MRRRAGALAPYFLVLPGGLWLAIFFVVPMAVMLSVSLQTGNVVDGFTQTFDVGVYADAITTYDTQFIRSLIFGLIATVATILLAYPMAYWIAFHAGRNKSNYLFLVLLPFFVSFVIRTVSWKFLLADDGIVLGNLKDAGLLPADFHVLATSFAVVAGLTYNFFPFMLLPIYVALERVDPRLLEAADDLYANRRGVFGRVVLPLSMPGVFAGFLLTFVPATSDFVNAYVLGGTNTTMIGNIIQTTYLTNADYPLASAVSFILMAVLLVGIFVYARLLGTRDVLELSAR